MKLDWSAAGIAAISAVALYGCVAGEVEVERPSEAEINEGLIDDARPRTTKRTLSRPGRYEPPGDVKQAGRRQTDNFDYDWPPRWEGGHQCSGSFRPGADRLADFVEREFGGISRVSGYNCRPIRGNSSRMSVHGTGRAIDIFIPLDGREADNDLGDPVANYLIRNATELGVQFIVWDSTKWNISYGEDRPYNGAHPHHDHIHVELTRESARDLNSFPDPQQGSSSGGSGGNSQPSQLTVPNGVSPNWADISNSDAIDLEWNAVAAADEYRIQMQYSEGSSWRDYYEWDTNDSGFRVWPQQRNTEYRWRVNACNYTGCSEWSDWRAFAAGHVRQPRNSPADTASNSGSSTSTNGSGGSTTNTGGATSGNTSSGLQPPGGLRPDGRTIHSGRVDLEWSSIGEATHYDVEMRYESNSAWRSYYLWSDISSAEKHVWPVLDRRKYSWRVRACDGSDCSGWSGWSTFVLHK